MEYWSDFFKLAKPKEAESGGVTLTTTTDTRRALDDAAEGRSRREPEANTTFTTVGPSLVLPDGAIEHGEPKVVSDAPKPKIDPSEHGDAVGPIFNPAEAAAYLANYESGLVAARSAYPDFDETVAATNEQIPVGVSRFIVARTSNGPLVVRYLATHPADCEKLRRLPLRAAQRHVEGISASIALDAAFGMDADDYRTFRAKRAAQIERKYR